MLRQDDFVKSLLVLEAWRQGKDFGQQPILMVLGCLANRQRLGWGSFFDVLQKVPKFSATLEQPNREELPDIWDTAFVKTLHAIDGVYDGSIGDPALGGLYWADLSKGRAGVTNPWFQEKILDVRTPCANQGPFTIFR
jgi:hypothetical protein